MPDSSARQAVHASLPRRGRQGIDRNTPASAFPGRYEFIFQATRSTTAVIALIALKKSAVSPSDAGLDYRDVGEGFPRSHQSAPACKRQESSCLHSLRQMFASLLIARRLDVVFVSRQLGHANPSITLKVYAHLYARADHATTAREALEQSYAAMDAGCRS